MATTAYPLPARDGLRLQLAGLLRELSQRVEVVLVAVVREGDDLAAAPTVCSTLVTVPAAGGRRRRLRQELATVVSRRPVLAEQVTSSGLPEAVREAVARYRPDVVHLTPGWLAELADVTSCPSVIVPLDASGPNWQADLAVAANPVRRYLSRRELSRMLRFEREAYSRNDAVVVVTERDADLLRASGTTVEPSVVTNGVDADRWGRPADAGPRDPDLVVFSGAMSYPPNVTAAVFAAREVLPALRERRPGVRLRVVGRDPAPEVRALAGPHVEVTGTVDDVRPHLWEAGAYLCPMRGGSGVKNKLLEALAAGAPSVVTRVATDGLDLVSGRDVLVADDPGELAAAVAGLLADPEAAARLGDAGAERARDLSWSRTADGFEAVYRLAIARHGGAS
ncbi:MAG: glycosyl transferase, group 1 [Frankiales bacterium]|nr:glycosyl transferase, group 1 [Frankiales bacterium]